MEKKLGQLEDRQFGAKDKDEIAGEQSKKTFFENRHVYKQTQSHDTFNKHQEPHNINRNKQATNKQTNNKHVHTETKKIIIIIKTNKGREKIYRDRIAHHDEEGEFESFKEVDKDVGDSTEVDDKAADNGS